MHFICSLLASLTLLSSDSFADSWDEALRARINQLNPAPLTHYLITRDITEENAEQAAISAFSWASNGNSRMIVGGALRAYSENIQPLGVWGADILAAGSPIADAQLVGAEIGVYQRNHNNRQAAVGVNIIFGNRLGVPEPVGGIGHNKYNIYTEALKISSQGRSPAGEYSGWGKVLKIDDFALDRTALVPYSTVIECGLRPSDRGLELWRDIEGIPTLYRIL